MTDEEDEGEEDYGDDEVGAADASTGYEGVTPTKAPKTKAAGTKAPKTKAVGALVPKTKPARTVETARVDLVDPSPEGQRAARRALHARVKHRGSKTQKLTPLDHLLLKEVPMMREHLVAAGYDATVKGILACEVTLPLLTVSGHLARTESIGNFRGSGKTWLQHVIEDEVMRTVPGIMLNKGTLTTILESTANQEVIQACKQRACLPSNGSARACFGWVYEALFDDALALEQENLQGVHANSAAHTYYFDPLVCDFARGTTKSPGAPIDAFRTAPPQIPVPQAAPEAEATPEVVALRDELERRQPAPGFDVPDDAADEPVEPWDPTEGLSESEDEEDDAGSAPEPEPELDHAAMSPPPGTGAAPPEDRKARMRARREARGENGANGANGANGRFWAYLSYEQFNPNSDIMQLAVSTGREQSCRPVCKAGITGRGRAGVDMRARESSAGSGTTFMCPILRVDLEDGVEALVVKLYPNPRARRRFWEGVEDHFLMDWRIARYRAGWLRGREWFLPPNKETWCAVGNAVWHEKMARAHASLLNRAANPKPKPKRQRTMGDYVVRG